MDRFVQLDYFYELLDDLENRVGERRLLRVSDGKMNWPQRGVYFFFEPGEFREDKKTPRVVRVGTHALKAFSQTTLWKRLRQHRGTNRGSFVGGGNHRGSIFRLHVGTAIIEKNQLMKKFRTWSVNQSAPRDIRVKEYAMEKKVSEHIRSMPFLWLSVSDPAGPDSMRGFIERNSIALLSNFSKEPIDHPSSQWLGHHCVNGNVRLSGLWNSNHVEDIVYHTFLEKLEKLVRMQ